jgi:hypothetical protein
MSTFLIGGLSLLLALLGSVALTEPPPRSKDDGHGGGESDWRLRLCGKRVPGFSGFVRFE